MQVVMQFADVVIDDSPSQMVGMGTLQVLQDEDLWAARIVMLTDQHRKICNHVICRGYHVNRSGLKTVIKN